MAASISCRWFDLKQARLLVRLDAPCIAQLLQERPPQPHAATLAARSAPPAVNERAGEITASVTYDLVAAVMICPTGLGK
jgi:hypothetical protein